MCLDLNHLTHYWVNISPNNTLFKLDLEILPTPPYHLGLFTNFIGELPGVWMPYKALQPYSLLHAQTILFFSITFFSCVSWWLYHHHRCFILLLFHALFLLLTNHTPAKFPFPTASIHTHAQILAFWTCKSFVSLSPPNVGLPIQGLSSYDVRSGYTLCLISIAIPIKMNLVVWVLVKGYVILISSKAS